MKLLKFILQIIILLTFSQHMQAQKNNPLIGFWLDYDLECPDIITLLADGKYAISNECYDNVSDKPYESGNWAINLKKKILVLKNRVFSTNVYYCLDSSAALTINYINITNGTLKGKCNGYSLTLFKIPHKKTFLKSPIWRKRLPFYYSNSKD